MENKSLLHYVKGNTCLITIELAVLQMICGLEWSYIHCVRNYFSRALGHMDWKLFAVKMLYERSLF